MKRLLLGIASGIGITFGLFFLMSALIQNDGEFKKDSSETASIEFLRQLKDSDADFRQRKKPTPPKPQEPQPQVPKLQISEKPQMEKPQMQMKMPQLASTLNKGKGPYLGPAQAGGGNQQALPVVRIEPAYPRRAAMKGLEGYVVLTFDITEAGTVNNVKVLESNPRRVFDSSARRALMKWKYKPKMVDGKALKQQNQTVKLEFKLES